VDEALQMKRAIAIVVGSAIFLGACASADGVEGDRALDVIEGTDVEQARQAFDDAACPTNVPDAISKGESVTSPDETYDHLDCPHRFIVTGRARPGATTTVTSTYAGGIGGEFVCSGSWAHVGVWARPVTGPADRPWTSVAVSQVVLGSDDGSSPCKATATLVLPAVAVATEYAAVAQAGWTITFQRVTVAFSR
jgi:hypothetical protein